MIRTCWVKYLVFFLLWCLLQIVWRTWMDTDWSFTADLISSGGWAMAFTWLLSLSIIGAGESK